ncbi:hypothetical protein B0J18DRAFT_494508 [Chaetomium sp. MPI-SDFR-AT-0129]|nr:hypothetical protein B0J18DRAFT_494508 [Chaetomium sp. MPI-SDFR-AT-0129]
MSPVSGDKTQLLVQDILSFSDEELVQYMKKNHGPSGFDLDVGDWAELEGEERERFAERLRWGAAQARVQEPSWPLDLDLLTARLQALPDEPNIVRPRISSAPTTSSAETTPSVDELELGGMKKREFTAAYEELVRTGGRPMFHVSQFDEVENNREGHRELFKPFLAHPDGAPSGFEFRGQLQRWQKFLTWQQDYHETYDEEKEFDALVEETRRKEEEKLAAMTTRQKRNRERSERRNLYDLRCKYRDAQQEKGLDDTEEGFRAFLDGMTQEYLKKGLSSPWMADDQKRQAMRAQFDIRERVRRQEFRGLRETRGGFPTYVDEVKTRLANHGFEQPFRLEQDHAKQDKLTTWIEYLNYEYSWQDSYERALPKVQAAHDEAWNKLAESGVLYPGENEEVLATFESKTTRQREKSDAYAAYQAARKNAEAALSETEKANVGQSAKTGAKRKRDLVLASDNLREAKATLRRLQRRSDLINDTFRATTDLPRTKHELRRQVILTQWIRDQVPLIQAELSASEHSASGSQSPKRGLPEDTESNQSPKRLRAGSGNHSSPDPEPEASLDRPSVSRDTSQPLQHIPAKKQRKKPTRTPAEQRTIQTSSPAAALQPGSPAAPPLRRSARIAARVNAAAAAEASSSSTSVRQLRAKPRTAAQKQGPAVSTAGPPVRGSGKKKGGAVNKAATRGGPKKSGGVSKNREENSKGKKAKGKTEKGKTEKGKTEKGKTGKGKTGKRKAEKGKKRAV